MLSTWGPLYTINQAMSHTCLKPSPPGYFSLTWEWSPDPFAKIQISSRLSCCLFLQPHLPPYARHPAGWDFELDLQCALLDLFWGLLRVGGPFPPSLPAPCWLQLSRPSEFRQHLHPMSSLPLLCFQNPEGFLSCPWDSHLFTSSVALTNL